MALPDYFYRQRGDGLLYRNVTDYGPAAANTLATGSPTAVQIDCTGLANGTARQAAKVDLGTPWAVEWGLLAAIEFAATPTAAASVEFWWAPSTSGTAGTANPGGVVGADGAYAGYSANLDNSIQQCQFIGTFPTTVQATGNVQIALVRGILRPLFRYGTLLVYNKTGAAFHNDMVETSFLLAPLVDLVAD